MNVRELGQPPTIVCLCGSTRFRAEYELANRRETFAGRIVLTVGSFTHAEAADFRVQQGPLEPDNAADQARCEGNKEHQFGEDRAQAMDMLHLWKIELAHEIVIVSDATRYIGRSTRTEKLYAEMNGKRVRWLVDELTPEELAQLPGRPAADEPLVPPGWRL